LKQYLAAVILVVVPILSILAQEKLTFSGSFQGGANWFLEDAEIGATNTPQYDQELVGVEAWLDLAVQYKGYKVGLRGDFFRNTNLLNPNGAYSDEGLGRWYVSKSINKFDFLAGHIYDQIGSGLIFRAYEERPLLIDNALIGGRIKYNPWPNVEAKVMAGKQKNLFSQYESFIRTGQIEGSFQVGKDKQWSLIPGFGIVNRSWSDNQVDDIIKSLETYTPQDSIGFYFHNWSFSAYNTVSYGPISFYLEGAFKTQDVYFDADAERNLYGGGSSLGRFANEDASIYYGALTYGAKGFAFSLSGRRTKNFSYRADPFASLNRGLVNFLPPMSRLNSARLKARYTPAARDISEKAVQLELRYTFNKKWKMVQYFSNITELDGTILYREFDNELTYRKDRFLEVSVGIQAQNYNQEILEGKTGVDLIRTFVPYFEIQKRLRKRRSMRIQAQYMITDQDFGSWLFGLAEFNLAPHWSFSVSDMYNVKPKKTDDLHYPRIDVTYNFKTYRFSLSYLKQVEGVVCAGGICRLEPAFSGFRFSTFSTF